MAERVLIDLTDLRSMAVKAVARAQAQAERTSDRQAKAGLKGRAEGINLVLSYLDDAVRMAALPTTVDQAAGPDAPRARPVEG